MRPAKLRSNATIVSAGACFWSTILSAFSFAIAPEIESQPCLMCGPAWRSSAREQRGVLGGRREVTLVDAVARRGDHGRLEQIGVGVPEEIGADPADEIEHGAPVGQPHARSASARRDERGHRERPPAQPRDLAQRAFVGLGREIPLAGRRANRLDQRLCRFAHSGRVDQRLQRMSLRAGHRRERIGLLESRLALKFCRARDDAWVSPCGNPPTSPRAKRPVTSLFLRGHEGALQRGGTPCRWRYATPRFRGAGAAARAKRSRAPNRRTSRCCARRGARLRQIPLAGEILVATYNVHRWTGINGRSRPDPARAGFVISELGADLISLQEVLRPDRGDDPLEALAEALGLHVVFAATRVHKRGEIGNAILSRWPIAGVTMLDLSYNTLERRVAIAAQIKTDEAELDVVATHLALADRTRHRQVKSLLDHPRLHQTPTLLDGRHERVAAVPGDASRSISSTSTTTTSGRPRFRPRVRCSRSTGSTRAACT